MSSEKAFIVSTHRFREFSDVNYLDEKDHLLAKSKENVVVANFNSLLGWFDISPRIELLNIITLKLNISTNIPHINVHVLARWDNIAIAQRDIVVGNVLVLQLKVSASHTENFTDEAIQFCQLPEHIIGEFDVLVLGTFLFKHRSLFCKELIDVLRVLHQIVKGMSSILSGGVDGDEDQDKHPVDNKVCIRSTPILVGIMLLNDDLKHIVLMGHMS